MSSQQSQRDPSTSNTSHVLTPNATKRLYGPGIQAGRKSLSELPTPSQTSDTRPIPSVHPHSTATTLVQTSTKADTQPRSNGRPVQPVGSAPGSAAGGPGSDRATQAPSVAVPRTPSAAAVGTPPSKLVRIKLKSSSQSSPVVAPSSDKDRSASDDEVLLTLTTKATARGIRPGSEVEKVSEASRSAITQRDKISAKLNDDFESVARFSALTHTPEDLDKIIVEYVEERGVPIVLSDLQRLPQWDAPSFSPDAYKHSLPGPAQSVSIKSLPEWRESGASIDTLLEHCEARRCYDAADRPRLYGDSLPCPQSWQDSVKAVVSDRAGYHGLHDLAYYLKPETRVISQVCCYGPGNSFVPLQRELCSTLGQNLMVWSDPGAASVWYIVKSDNAEQLTELSRSSGGHSHAEGFALHSDKLQKATFPVFCCSQQVGDLVLLPSGAFRQVSNVAGRTMKVAWTRLTIDSLENALHFDLPQYQRTCRKETHRIKAVVESVLGTFSHAIASDSSFPSEHSLLSLRRALNMYDQILSDEYVPDWKELKADCEETSYVECDFCGADCLLSYFECSAEHTLCSLCYCQGRLCSCDSTRPGLRPCQLFVTFEKRLEMRNTAARLLQKYSHLEEDQPPVRELLEKDIKKTSWPHSFMAACRLYALRQSSKQEGKLANCKLCNSTVTKTTGYKCKPCHAWYCFRCLLHKAYIHPVHVLAQSNATQFHNYHEEFSTKDYAEWKQNPEVFFIEAQVHFALIEEAITHQTCVPLDPKCRIGFLDVMQQPVPTETNGTTVATAPQRIAKRPLATEWGPVSMPQAAASAHKRTKSMPETEDLSSSARGKASLITKDLVASTSASSANSTELTQSRHVSAQKSEESAPTSGTPLIEATVKLAVARMILASQGAIAPSSEPKGSGAAKTPIKKTGIPRANKTPVGIDASQGLTAAETVSTTPARSAPSVSPTPSGSRDRQASTAQSPPANALVSSLSSLDSKSLKILTEILGIFSKDVNQRGVERHVDIVGHLDASDAKHNEVLQELREYRAEQQKVLQTMQQMLRSQQEHSAREEKRHKDMMEQIVELQEAMGELTGDVTRGAQARLELEKRSAASEYDTDAANAFIHLTSNTRSK